MILNSIFIPPSLSKNVILEALNRLYSLEQLNSKQETLFKDEE